MHFGCHVCRRPVALPKRRQFPSSNSTSNNILTTYDTSFTRNIFAPGRTPLHLFTRVQYGNAVREFTGCVTLRNKIDRALHHLISPIFVHRDVTSRRITSLKARCSINTLGSHGQRRTITSSAVCFESSAVHMNKDETIGSSATSSGDIDVVSGPASDIAETQIPFVDAFEKIVHHAKLEPELFKILEPSLNSVESRSQFRRARVLSYRRKQLSEDIIRARRFHGLSDYKQKWEELFESLQLISKPRARNLKTLTIIVPCDQKQLLRESLHQAGLESEILNFGMTTFTRVSGSAGSVTACVRSLQTYKTLQIVQKESHITISPLNLILDTSKIPRSRRTRRIDKVEWPKAWDPPSLELFVVRLVRLRTPKMFESHQVDKKMSAFEEIFSRIAGSRIVPTARTFQVAIHFLLKHKNPDLALSIYAQMKDVGHVANSEARHLVPRFASREQDLGQFRKEMHFLVKEGFKGDWQSWAASFPLSTSPEIQHRVLSIMYARGYFNDSNAAKIVAPYVITSMLDYMASHHDNALHYISALNQLFGPIWLSNISVHNLMQNLCLLGRPLEAVQVLEHLSMEWGFLPEAYDINNILDTLLRQEDLSTAIWLVSYIHTRWAIVPNAFMYHNLFKLARLRKYFNVARVVWKYTLLAGHVTLIMREHVFQSLIWRATERPLPRVSPKQDLGAIVTESFIKANDYLGYRAAAELVMERELSLIGRMRAVEPFTAMLRAAFVMDLEMDADGCRATRDVHWWVENAISIAMVPVEGKAADEQVWRRTWSEERLGGS